MQPPPAKPTDKKRSRAPSFDRIPKTCPTERLEPGFPGAPVSFRLPLLPSGSDGVHGLPPPRTQLSTSTRRIEALDSSLGREFHPAVADCGFRAPLAPHVARLPLNPRAAYSMCQRVASHWRRHSPLIACPVLDTGQALSDSEGSKVLASIPPLQYSDQVLAEGF